jgi:cysteinyl-tRNA synthetase
MSRKLLGETFDIHGGGLDLVFPHHENEIAQSECCHRKPMVKYWMHNGLLKAAPSAGKLGGRAMRESAASEPANDAGDKMSRSKGAGGLAALIERHGGERIRFFLLRTHYRSTVVFSEEAVEEAGTGLETFYRLFERYERITGKSFYNVTGATTRTAGAFEAGSDPLLAEVARLRGNFLAKMDDDFNTGAAVSELFDFARAINKFIEAHDLEGAGRADPALVASLSRSIAKLRELSALLGLFLAPVPKDAGTGDALVGKLMQLLIDIRENARKNKDFATADQVRNRLAELGVTIEDRKGETTWRRE